MASVLVSFTAEYDAKNLVELLRLVVHAMCNEHPRGIPPVQPGAPVRYEYLCSPTKGTDTALWWPSGSTLHHYLLLPKDSKAKDAQDPQMQELMRNMGAGTGGSSRGLQLIRKSVKAGNSNSAPVQLYPSPRFLQMLACAPTLRLMLNTAAHVCQVAV